MSVTLGLMAASAAYSAYNNYQASEAQQAALADQLAFHTKYLEELDRRQEVNETLALEKIKQGKGQISVTAAALGQSTSSVSTLESMENFVALSMEQMLRDREEFEWERQAAAYKGEAMEGQLDSMKKAQMWQLGGDLLSAGYQTSKYYDSGLPKGYGDNK